MTTNTITTYSLSEAADACGMSQNRFRAHKNELVKLGVTVSSSGWVIPETALREIGWLGQKAPRKKEQLVKVSELTRYKNENASLRARVAELEEALSKKKGFSLFGKR